MGQKKHLEPHHALASGRHRDGHHQGAHAFWGRVVIPPRSSLGHVLPGLSPHMPEGRSGRHAPDTLHGYPVSGSVCSTSATPWNHKEHARG